MLSFRQFEDGGPGLETSGVTRTGGGGRKTEGGRMRTEDPLERGEIGVASYGSAPSGGCEYAFGVAG